MRRLFLFLLALTLTLAGTATFTTSRAGAVTDMDCGDFATQAAAQAFFVGAGPGDPHALDHDDDGVACESNPCPCSTSVAPLVGTTTTSPTPTPTPAPTPTPTPTPTSTPTPGVDPDGSGSSGPERRDRARVVRVTDGDTLKVQMADGTEEYVRIIGIDTPEVHGRRECGGGQASRTMGRLAPVGSRVLLVSDPTQADRDRYGRLLRYVHRSGKDVGRAQVALGRARVYVYRADPFRRTAPYQRAERRASAQQRGSWGTCWR
ncbi:endonuclease YncB(thermonuclease family) [Nocardioides cavernae]|uniref:Endonuclease YncB(Thermonuclease family) n=1 Tax=Nocardioides cavernae TaxID=1921566 RepID=A0A7Y9KUE1_9ACTN|nr:thermonuclease family protein [Nocardioides cavernae]NYE38562.1 endonuclease YncB(thermonuclease family) [Nocardioides cavernae]